ncbi:hypothetical protein GobsT_65570 [Gemmata obscuriglobus]|uniref:DUF4351 domain-containing protein n=1 Tax=Gemmata obscuriglobus TaxID=114 RepID=A0A2Z3H451_9BACT|nr:hypothetical protein [Gemmata obscuriglobus]AWM35750.1 hypothetical protein C1280_01065 [Gemmata obscuriglobus]QEG31713.1 hypothetical protein GobsT_65570 [Gemmata obscuriglobus]VTS11059.1 unnamed protein product [Gemmata obscuriglobus UQM 2246]
MPENHFDKAARFAAQLEPPEFLAWLLDRPATALGFAGWLDTRGIPFPGEPDRVGDTVARLTPPDGSGPPWALAIEFQIDPDPLMFGRLLGYLSQLWTRLKPDPERGSRFNVGAAVVNLTGAGSASREMRLPGTPVGTHLAVAERNLAGENADHAIGRIEAGASGRSVLPWLPLMAGGGEGTIIERWKRLAEQEPSSRRRSELGGLALVFAEAAGCRENWELGLKGWNVRESAVVNGWKAEARAEARAETQVEERAAAVLAVLEAKFGTVPADLAGAVRATADLARLQQWIALAARADTRDGFRAAAGV